MVRGEWRVGGRQATPKRSYFAASTPGSGERQPIIRLQGLEEARAILARERWRQRGITALWVVGLLALAAAGLWSWLPPTGGTGPIAVLVSLDGFRASYLPAAGPALRRLVREGVRAEYLRPVMPSKTFPNHYSLATGLYAESHGIVANSFRDPDSGEVFTMASKEPHWWTGGEPLWVTAEKQGVRTAPAMWPGADVNFSSIGAPGDGLPSAVLPYSREVGKMDRVDFVLAQLRAADPPRLLSLYMEDVDDEGHRHGPDSPEMQAAIRAVDGGLARLLEGIATLPPETRGRVHVIVVGDHGMVGTNSERTLVLPELHDNSELRTALEQGAMGTSPILGLRPEKGREEAVISMLRAAVEREAAAEAELRGGDAPATPRMEVYRKRDLPTRWHWRNSPRVPPIVGVVAEGWTLQAERARPDGGAHGYDNSLLSMASIFVAWGPTFAARAGEVVPAFDNVEVYRLLAHLLELDRLAPNNGTEAVTQRVLGHKTDDGQSQQRSSPVWPEPKSWSAGVTAVLVDPQLRVSWQLPAGSAEPPAGLERAVERFRAAAFPHRTAGNLNAAAAGSVLGTLSIAVTQNASAALQLGVAESHSLRVPGANGSITLTAETQVGVYHGLETLAQLINFDFDTMEYRVARSPVRIDDAPRFPHREILMDR